MPFVAKAIGHPVAKYASLLMAGLTLAEIGFTEEPPLSHVAVKEAVLPFDKFPGPCVRGGPPWLRVALDSGSQLTVTHGEGWVRWRFKEWLMPGTRV